MSKELTLEELLGVIKELDFGKQVSCKREVDDYDIEEYFENGDVEYLDEYDRQKGESYDAHNKRLALLMGADENGMIEFDENNLDGYASEAQFGYYKVFHFRDDIYFKVNYHRGSYGESHEITGISQVKLSIENQTKFI